VIFRLSLNSTEKEPRVESSGTEESIARKLVKARGTGQSA